ncbi:MAG: FAD-dependent oxidoreductase [Candidatus Hydrogenedens sp.]|nr:FAD-dependent oxidoreductase [Candidatus Hydrogenedens sp.]
MGMGMVPEDVSRRMFLAVSGGLVFSGPLLGGVAMAAEVSGTGALPGSWTEKAVGEGDGVAAEVSGPGALPASWTEKELNADVVVAGGGLAGVCAAIAAARNGASVVLVQDRSRLGGNSSSEIRMHVCGANNSKNTVLWRESGIIEELKLTESATNLQRSFEMWDLVLYDKVVSEPNITLMLDTAVVGTAVENGRITRVTAASPLLEERYEITADFFLDCTGDAAVAALSGATCMLGREGRDQYGESLAPEVADEKTMGNSLLFMARKHDRPMPFTPPPWARKFTKEDFRHRRINSWEYGYWWIEWGGELDTIKDNRKIRHELLRILLGVWDHIKNSGEHPQSEPWALEWVGMIPGKRESRRILGEHVMVQRELEEAELYPDRVSFGGWPMDDHPPGGMDDRDLPPCIQIQFERPYSVPLRSLFSADRPNLLMAGRNISASHVALTSTRVMATCAAMGQAAGTAAAFCAAEKCLPRDAAADPARMMRLQQRLLRDDQSLLGMANADPEDLARTARVTCSHHAPEGAPEQVTDGWNRDIGDGNAHQWRAAMDGKEPWLQLEWGKPVTLRRVQFTFDTGLHRRLSLSGEDWVINSQTRGAQPETVADYAVEARVEGAWREVARNTGNYLRLARHAVGPVTADALRLRVLRTNGDGLARVFEVRCYG